MAGQEIKCSVGSCRYNDKMLYCTLHDITVGNSILSDAHQKSDTECASFAPEE